MKLGNFIMLCGVPGSGKSTWTRNFVADYQYRWPLHKIMILSTDDILQDIADRHGLTYNDVFGPITYSFAERMMHKLAGIAFQQADLVIWDQTNLNAKTRAKKLALVPKDWYKRAVAFSVPADLEERLASRPGKIIPRNVIQGMIRGYKPPVREEGFNMIDIINTP